MRAATFFPVRVRLVVVLGVVVIFDGAGALVLRVAGLGGLFVVFGAARCDAVAAL